jgi:predicted acetyltransferase/predicted RNA methylase
MELGNILENTAWLYDYDNRDNLIDDILFYNEYALKTGGQVLELGCGTGRVALRLAESGFKITGLDLSDSMLKIFNEKLKDLSYRDNITLVKENMAKFDLREKFELIIAPFRAFQALTEEEDIVSCLSCVKEHLSDKGLFILNVFRPNKELDEDWCYDEKIQWEAFDANRGYKIVKKHWGDKIDTVNQIIYPHYAFEIADNDGNARRVEEHLKLKYYYYDQIVRHIEDAGLSIVEEYGWYDKSSIENGRELIFVCKKMDVKLIAPSKEYEKEAFEYIKEFLDNNSEVNGTGGLDRFANYDDWLLKIARDIDFNNIPEGKVPANTYFLVRISDNKIIGMINLRHKLNEFLLNEGGHIGYSIRPTERKKGYATIMLKLALQRCRELNLDKVLITCDKVNIASAKVIHRNSGVLENELFSETFSEIIQRYWIKL